MMENHTLLRFNVFQKRYKS